MEFPNEKICLQVEAAYSKEPGQLTITNKRICWTAAGKKTPSVIIPHSQNIKLYMGKNQNVEPKFKLSTTTTPAQDYLFVLENPKGWTILPKIQAAIASFIAAEKSSSASPSNQRSAAPSPSHQRSAAPSPASGSSSPSIRNGSIPPTGKNAPLRKGPTQKELETRREILTRDKYLADRHTTLVVQEKCITEEEFWALRKNLLRDQSVQMAQQKGRSSIIPTLRPVTEESGDSKVNIHKSLIDEIFDEYPRVKLAFDEYVKKQKMLSEGEFWKRYVQSKFNDRANGSLGVSDEIFDKCWEETERDLNNEDEPGRKRIKVSIIRDLNTTKEDHLEVDLEQDITMKPGRQVKIISLIRRNNRHGSRILEASRRKEASKSDEYINEIMIEDLNPEQPSDRLKLDIKDQREYFAGQKTGYDFDFNMEDIEKTNEILNDFKASFANWKSDLSGDSDADTPASPLNNGNAPHQPVSDDVWKEALKIAREMINPLRISICKALGLPLEQDQNGAKAITQKTSINRDMNQHTNAHEVTSQKAIVRDVKNDASFQKTTVRDKNFSDQKVSQTRDHKINSNSQKAVRDAKNDSGSRKLVTRDAKNDPQAPNIRDTRNDGVQRTNGEIKQKRVDASRSAQVSSGTSRTSQGQPNGQTSKSSSSRQHDAVTKTSSSASEIPKGSTRLSHTSNQETPRHTSSTRDASKNSSSTRVTLNVNREEPPQAQRREQSQSSNRIVLKGVPTTKPSSSSSSTKISQNTNKAGGVKRKR
ncbi:16097_t:CDS:10 [Acaulospora morrowiae]|uniref:16097_t:CDS:1 n=1 Tax=Acaulospora morrowiae TaxID=94023 RepID=A0A9N8VXM1_9GLOM|nr:16097_t:CDS:10 [Acaulospora morrowiae]